MSQGRFYNDSDIATGAKSCAITSKDAIKAFGTDDVIGMDVEVSLYDVTVSLNIVGVVKDKTESSMIMGGYTSDSISLYIPYTTFESFGVENVDDITGFYITTDKVRDSQSIADESLALLRSRHHVTQDDYFMLQDANDQIGQINDMMSMVTTFISFVAAISLLVGGIGVMNIMLVSVTERTREIGIRKSLGAKTGSIMLQFLAESAIIACLGGIIGIIIGVAVAYIICSIPALGFAPGIKVSTILLATLFSSGIGIFFGIYPARKAARLNPIDALRSN